MPLASATRDRIENLLAANRVVLFMKGTREAPQCGFSAATTDRLNALLDDYATVNVLADEEVVEAVSGNAVLNGIPVTVEALVPAGA